MTITVNGLTANQNKRVLDKIKELSTLAYCLSHDGFSVFVDFSGHVWLASIRVFKDGWVENPKFGYYENVYFNTEGSEQKSTTNLVCSKFQNVIDEIKEIYDERFGEGAADKAIAAIEGVNNEKA